MPFHTRNAAGDCSFGAGVYDRHPTPPTFRQPSPPSLSSTPSNPVAAMTSRPAAPPSAPGAGAADLHAGGRWLGTMCILGSLFGWSSIPLFLRYFTDLIDGWTANGWRYAVSAVLWMPVLVFGWARGTLPKGLWRAALVPSILNILAQIAFGLAPYYVSPGLMTFSLRLQVIFVTVGAAILFVNERRIITSRGFMVGMSLVILGTLLTIALKPGGLGTGSALGVTLSILAGLGYAAYALAVRKCMHAIPPITAFAAVSVLSAAGIFAVMLVFAPRGGMVVFDLSSKHLLLLALSSIIGVGLGHTFYFISIARLGLAVSAGVVQLQPIFVSIGSMYLFQEVLTSGQWAMGVVAIVGASIMLYTQHRLARAAGTKAVDELDELPVDAEVAMIAQANDEKKPGTRGARES